MNTPDHEYESETDDCDVYPSSKEERLDSLRRETARIKRAQKAARERFGE